MTIERTKLLPYGLAIVATGVAVYGAFNPVIETQVQTKVITQKVEVVKFKDRVKVVKEVVTKPDGTRIDREIRDETKSGSDTKKDIKEDERTEITVRRLPSYSVGVNYNLLNSNPVSAYTLVGGFRLGQLPLSLEVGGGINRILIGVRLDF